MRGHTAVHELSHLGDRAPAKGGASLFVDDTRIFASRLLGQGFDHNVKVSMVLLWQAKPSVRERSDRK